VTLEESSHAQIHPFLASIAEPIGIQLRSASLRNEKEDSPARLEPEQILPHTPLSELTTSNLESAQVWEQLELRAPGYVKVAKEIVQSGAPPEMGDLEEEEDLEEEGSDEEMDEEEFRRMLEEGELGDLTDEQIEEMMAKAEEEGDSDEDESGSEDEDDDDEEDSEGDDMSNSEDDEVTFEDGTRIGDSDEEEDDEMLGSGSDLEMDDDEEEDGENDDDDAEDEDEEDDSAQAGPSRRRRHPTLDDQFFSIDEFNRMTEEAEASHLSSGRLDDDEEEELDEDVGQLMLNGVGDDDGEFSLIVRTTESLMAEIMYTDFFDAPRTIEKPVGKSKSKPKAGKSKGKGKGKNVKFGDEDEDDEEALDEDAREVMGRFKEDLFADDDEEEEADDQRMFP
jgi:U3 small nucleolar RNA-associated protein MPP10